MNNSPERTCSACGRGSQYLVSICHQRNVALWVSIPLCAACKAAMLATLRKQGDRGERKGA